MNATRKLFSLGFGGSILASVFSITILGISILSTGVEASAQTVPGERAWARAILTEFETTLRSPAKSSGFDLVLVVDDKSASESASANRKGAQAIVTVDGGLLKSPRLTPDGLRTVLCHELGHVLGGAPRRNVPPEWDGPVAHDGLSELTSEGQADYYASAICFRRLVKGQDHRAILNSEPLPTSKTLSARCEQAHGRKTEAALICERAARGGRNMLVLVKEFPVDFDVPSKVVAPNLIRNQYPDRQCRLDTFIAGALCAHESTSLALDFDDARLTECPMPEARRPSCWYPAPHASFGDFL